MSKSYLSLLIVCSLTLLIIVSCKRDAPMQDQAIINVDFLLNERDLDKFGLEYTEQEFERDNDDPNKVLTIKVGEPVKFKDTSKGSSSSSNRRWVLNDNEWKQAENDEVIDVPEFTHVFDEPGYYKISLMFGESKFSNNYATKLIKVVSGDYVPSDDVASTEMDISEEEEKDLFADNNNNNSTTTTQPGTNTTNNTQPNQQRNTTSSTEEPARVNSVNFVVPSEVEVGKSFELRDISAPATAVNLRQWDLGDGTTQRTNGSTYRHMYFSEGTKSVTLCLNNSDQCITKRITVNPRPVKPAEVATRQEEKPQPKAPAVKKPEVASVEFTMPETALAGSSVNLSDRSQPSSAVMKRTWSFGDGTPDLNTGKSAISHVFNKAGEYNVKVCVNDSDKCSTKKIVISEKPEPVEEVVAEEKPEEKPGATTTTASTGGFDYDSYTGAQSGRVGLLSSQKCDDMTSEWFTGTASIIITPKKGLELEEAKLYASENGTIDIILKNSKGEVQGEISNVQVNPGPTVVYLTDLATILIPGEKYTLTLKPSNEGSDLRLINSVKCSPNPLPSDIVSVAYNKNLVLYDLRFYY